MKLTLQKRVTFLIAAVVIMISVTSSLLFLSSYKKSMEREIIARGITMAESLSRAVDDGVAAENLDLIKSLEDIVHTKDVTLSQVYSSLWLAIDSYPADRQSEPPAPAAIEYFKTEKNTHAYFFTKDGLLYDFYTPIYYDYERNGHRNKDLLIGYIRLTLSSEQFRAALKKTIATNIAVSGLLALIAIALLNALIRKYVLLPVLTLHKSVSSYRQGNFPSAVPVHADDELGELSAEFNEMSLALKEREERLSEEKERLTVTLRSIGDAVIVTDTDGKITLINKVAEKHTGWSMQEASGMHLTEVFNIINEKTRVQCENPVDKVLESGLIVGLANHTALIRKDGTEIIIEDSAAPIRDRSSKTSGVVLVFRDVTEKHKMEEELLKVEKLESVGVLAGGIAHDFNNLLTSIIGNISLAKLYIDSGNKAQERLADAETATIRATNLTQQLLTFSKGGAPVKKMTSIVDMVRESAGLTLAGTNISPEYSIAAEVWNVEVDPGQISQVFNNLIINAVQAMPKGGTIWFQLNNVVLGQNEVPPLHEGRYVKISVKDTGIGIPREHLPHIFDPYFTTKKKGSGLGLASVFSIIKRHDGHITVESIPAGGTHFHVYLPASPTASVAAPPPEEGITHGRGRILVMDDEKMVRDISGEMLRSLGYEAFFAEHGARAVAMYQEAFDAGEPFDAVIMDLTIPGGMGGGEAIEKLRAIHPDVRAVVSSGYSNDPIMASHQDYGFKAVMIKPYNLKNFSTVLREVLKQ
ncbi:MAG: hypothetical protein C0402_08000 [Thermodesulfovibrio sp.]|nr:hypothetical protein [Thermodesulfovibrio sp.]